MTKDEQWISFLGLAARARKLITGEELVIKELRRRAIKLVILSADASETTKKKVTDKCTYYDVAIRVASDRKTLGNAIGKNERVVIGVTDDGFSRKLKTLMDR